MSVSKGVALVTGSAQGIGRGIALRLARDGFDIALNDVASKRDQLHAVANDVDKLCRKAHVIPADVTVEAEVSAMVHDTIDKLGGLDVMVANAGICSMSPLVSTNLDEWERVMAVNARGVFLCYKHAATRMIAQGRGGRIVAASSAAGRIGQPILSAYSASKFAVRGLTQAAAQELGRYGITVNAYAPGAIHTGMDVAMPELEKLSDEEMEDVKGLGSRMIGPIKLEGQAEDIANVVSYLVSKEARFVTGQCISVDGGIVMS